MFKNIYVNQANNETSISKCCSYDIKEEHKGIEWLISQFPPHYKLRNVRKLAAASVQGRREGGGRSAPPPQ